MSMTGHIDAIAAPSPMRDDAAAESRRLAMEAEAIDRALESVAAGRFVTEAQFDAWVDSLGTDHELPPPRSGK